MNRKPKKTVRNTTNCRTLKGHQGIFRIVEDILNRLRAGYSLITHIYLMDGAAYNFPPVCPLCNDELTAKHVLVVCNALSDVQVNCGLVNPDDNTNMKYILGNNTTDSVNFF